jgi:hypothetical protein
MLSDRLDEALKGRQHILDKNKNGKLDSQDFKMLRGKKKRQDSSKVFPRLGDILSETEEAEGSRTTRPRKGPTRTSKSQRDPNVSASQRRTDKKYYKQKPEAARRFEFAGRRLRQMLNKDDKK